MADEEQIIENPKAQDGEKDDEDELDQEAIGKEDLNCRFYGNEFPEVEDLVMVSIRFSINFLFILRVF